MVGVTGFEPATPTSRRLWGGPNLLRRECRRDEGDSAYRAVNHGMLRTGLNALDLYGWIWLHLWRD
jgi:hypothetical protein